LPSAFEFSVRDGVLMAHVTGRGTFAPTIVDEHTLEYGPAGIRLVFDAVDDGQHQAFTLEQGGQLFRFHRHA
jgi:hypothetical protein